MGGGIYGSVADDCGILGVPGRVGFYVVLVNM